MLNSKVALILHFLFYVYLNMLTTKDKIKLIYQPWLISSFIFTIGFTLCFTFLKSIFLDHIDLFSIDFIFPVIFGFFFVFVYLYKFPFSSLIIENKFNFTRSILFYTITPLYILQHVISKYLLKEQYIQPLILFVVLEVFILLVFLSTLKFVKVKHTTQL